MMKSPKPGDKALPRKLVANQPFGEPTMSDSRQDGSYKGSSGQKTAKEIPIFTSSANRSSGPLK